MRVVVTVVIKNPRQDKFLIVKKKSSAQVHASKWLFPGGKVERGEDAVGALRREIKEETGLEITGDVEQISDYEYERPGNETAFGLCFSCTASSEEVRLSDELEDFAWVTLRQFRGYDHVAGLEKEARRAFKGWSCRQRPRSSIDLEACS